jgi:hypothetical protein
VLALWVLVLSEPVRGAEALAVYGLAQGMLLVLEVIAMGLNNRLRAGLFGEKRMVWLFSCSGAVLLAYAVFLFGSAEPTLSASQRPKPRTNYTLARPTGPSASQGTTLRARLR